jgi:tetratricopeptide (TPR) repeat protein
MKERMQKWLLRWQMTNHVNDEGESSPGDMSLDVEGIERLLEDPVLRTRLAAVIREQLEESPAVWRRVGPLLASVSSALVILLAFLIPSLQEQWDRFHARQVIQRHVELGRSFLHEGKYKLAEQSFAKAFELSENKRLDIEEERLTAKVQEMNEDPTWGVKNPEGLEEADFLYLLQLQRDPSQSHERAVTQNCYGVFLAAAKRWREAKEQFREAIRLNPADSTPFVNLGNLLRDRNRLKEAEEAYRTALRLDTDDGRVYYDLGLVLAETNRPVEAEEAFRHAVTLEPKDPDLLRAFAQQLKKNGKSQEARKVIEQLPSVEPTDKDARGGGH